MHAWNSIFSVSAWLMMVFMLGISQVIEFVRVFDGKYFPVLDAVGGDLGAAIGDGVARLYLDGVGFGHFFW